MTASTIRMDDQPSVEPASTSKKELDDPCEICKDQKAKYTCPACFTRTCTLPCVQVHKTTFQCDGVARRTKMVPLNQYDALTLLNDYRFLEDATRLAQASKNIGFLEVTKESKRDFRKTRDLIAECVKRGIRLQLAPWGLGKSLANTTAYNPIAETIFWKIEWVFVDAGNFTLEIDKNLESVKLETLLRQFIKPRHGFELPIPQFLNDKRFSKYQVPHGQELSWACYMKYERSGWTKDTRYFQLDTKKTVCENLVSNVVVEFPTIYVAGTSDESGDDVRFPTLTDEDLKLLADRRSERRALTGDVRKRRVKLKRWKRRTAKMSNGEDSKNQDETSNGQENSKDQLNGHGQPKNRSESERTDAKTEERFSKPDSSTIQENVPMKPLRRLLNGTRGARGGGRGRGNHNQFSGRPGFQEKSKHNWNPFAAKRVEKRKAIDDLADALSFDKTKDEDEPMESGDQRYPSMYDEEEKGGQGDRRYPSMHVEEKVQKSAAGKKNDYFSLLGFNYASDGSNDDSELEEGEIR